MLSDRAELTRVLSPTCADVTAMSRFICASTHCGVEKRRRKLGKTLVREDPSRFSVSKRRVLTGKCRVHIARRRS
jgi:hypothetical protein